MEQRVLALDIGGSKLVAGVVDPDGSIVCRASRAFEGKPDIDRVRSAIDACVAEIETTGVGYSAIGALVPGLADPQTGMWVHASYSGIGDWAISRELSLRYGGWPVFIENDVNACALAERRFGCCRDTRDYLWVTISNGIGGSLVLDGKLYPGAYGNAGELGHLCVEEERGLPCGCGNRGCLEAQASGQGIARLYEAMTGIGCTAREIADRARSGDELATQAFDRAGHYLGKALSFAINLINPEKVVLGGGVAQSGDLFLPALESTLEAMVFRAANPKPCVEITPLGYHAALLGAATIALEGLGIFAH